MLSKILSVFFRIGFVLVLIITVLQIISQARRSEVTVGSNNSWILARPGIDVSTTRHFSDEHPAPDTVVTFKRMNATGDSILKSISTSHSLYRRMGYPDIPIDTQVTVVLDDLENYFLTDSVTTYYNDGKHIKRATNRKHIFGGITEETEPKQILRILPGSNQQHILFIVIDILKFGSIALMCFLFMRLFSNFGKREYFTISNIRILIITGCLILVPQIVMECLYWFYRTDFQPAKGIISNGSFKIFATYSLTSNLQLFKIIAGFGLIIISYGFKKGLLYKIDSSLNI